MTASTYLDRAARIGVRLAERALWDNDGCAWPDNDGSANSDVYGGSAGTALFLAELDRLAPDRSLRRTAEGALVHAVRGSDRFRKHAFYTGRVGIVYALARAGRLWSRDDFLRDAVNLLLSMRDDPTSDATPDLQSGAAGAIPVLLHLGEDGFGAQRDHRRVIHR